MVFIQRGGWPDRHVESVLGTEELAIRPANARMIAAVLGAPRWFALEQGATVS